jgi:TRAP-type C4-dicarboxylate transport system permease small subunit
MLKKIQDWTIAIQRVIFITAMAFMLVTLVTNVIMRYIFSKSLVWSEEVTSLLQGGVTFLGIGYCFARKKHTELTIVHEKLPPKMQALFDIITNAIILGCLLKLTIVAFDLVGRQMIPLGTVKWLKLGYFYMMIPIGFIIGGVHIMTRFITAIQRMFSLLGEKTAGPAV